MIIKRSVQENSFLFFAIFLLALLTLWIVTDILPVQGAGLTFSVNTTISLTGTGEILTIASGSTASSVAVGTSNVVVTVGEGDKFTLSISNRSLAAQSTSGNALITSDPCYSNLDSLGKLTVIGDSGGGSATIQTAVCTTKGSGGGISQQTDLNISPLPSTPAVPTTTVPALVTLPSTPTITDLQLFLTGLAEQLTLVNKINVTSPDALKILEQIRLALDQALIKIAVAGGEVVIPPGGSYTANLYQGTSGDEVSSLQTFLKVQGTEIYPEGLVTGYFGPLTKAAVGRFQIKYGIVSDEDDPDYGYVGPGTREKINSLLGL